MAENEKFFHEKNRGRKEEISIIVEVKEGKIEKIHNSYIYQPAIHFKGGSITWHEDQVHEDQ